MALLNLGGYGLFMAYLEDGAAERLDQQLDDNSYDTSKLITFRIAVTSLPYYTNSETYERKNGKIEINGVTYNYVKKRIFKDSLEVVCVLNEEATQLHTARNEFYKLCNDLQNAEKNKKAGASFKFFSPGNCKEKKVYTEIAFQNQAQKNATRASFILPYYYTNEIENPPEHHCLYTN